MCTDFRQLLIVGITILTTSHGGSALGEYQGVTVTLHTSVNTPNGAKSVYRAYALFSNPGDFLVAVVGTPTLGNIVIRNLDASGSVPGSGFYNPAGTNRAPILQPGDPEEYSWETFVTIGGPLHDGTDQTSLSPGSPAFINGSQLNSNSVGWWFGPAAQGRAENGVLNPGNMHPGLWGVLMMQLTVDASEHVAGTVAVAGVNSTSPVGGTTFQTQANQTFSSIPAPGGLAVLAVAGLLRSRNRLHA